MNSRNTYFKQNKEKLKEYAQNRYCSNNGKAISKAKKKITKNARASAKLLQISFRRRKTQKRIRKKLILKYV